jgi:hypothetical protein
MLSQTSLFLTLYELLISMFYLFSDKSLLFLFNGDFFFPFMFFLLLLRENILSLFEEILSNRLKLTFHSVLSEGNIFLGVIRWHNGSLSLSHLFETRVERA